MTDTSLAILIVDDDESDAHALRDELIAAGLDARFQVISRRRELLDALHSHWDVVLHDAIVPHIDWRETLDQVRTQNPYAVFVLISGKRGEAYAVEAMRAGCNDYIIKDALVRLVPAVQRELQAVAARRSKEQAQRRLEAELQRSRRLEMMGRLSASLGHNLNNVFHVVMFVLDDVHTSLESHEAREMVEDAVGAVEKGARMVRQLNSLGRTPAFVPAHVDLAPMIASIANLVRPALPKGIQLTTTSSPSLQPVVADGLLLEHALLNLMLNARDALGESGHISVSLEQADEEMVITVRDDGPGVPASLRERIFEPFYTTKGTHGTGLGLATVVEALKAHGGSVNLQSTRGHGATFELRFPAARAKASTAPAERVAVGRTKRLLLVDDAEDSLLLTKRGLVHAGFDVETANTVGAAVLALQDDLGFDVVVAETAMAGGGARGLLEGLRSQGNTIPVVAVASFDVERWDEYRLYQGFAGFLAKPFRARELVELISRALAGAPEPS